MPSFDEKYAAALDELERTKMWPSNYAPPLHRLLRKMGLPVRPPNYMNVWQVLFGSGIVFGAIWGLIMWFWQWRDSGMSLSTVFVAIFTVGIIYGGLMALFHRRAREKWGLSKWEDL